MNRVNNLKLLPEHVAALADAERQLLDVLPDLDKLEKCDIDCQAMKDEVKAGLKAIETLKMNFGSG